ncbi:SMC-Scp complex subunit ScpB [Candidatus Albibeggiatoa sp. nov. NOAA]|uniref:SMC-Scp complex subunit ScpB n=1 Tax=Candidatus Albibeggiatoa sp. nov. NOAA TaxID=3162724 RepID=UPI0032F2A23D|nr:SMC-Scp complex subunit ScpB [Thiotrichaceae bacterium]
MTEQQLKNIIEAALFAASRPLTIDHFLSLFPEAAKPERGEIRACLKQLTKETETRGIELVQVASGYRFQVKAELTIWVKQLYPKRPPRQSRALMEILAIIAYRQPITRSEIESIRGVSVSTQIMKTLLDYQWVRVLAHKDTPGRPALYGTTRHFLDHFNLKNLNGLPSLNQLKDMEELDAFDNELQQVMPDETDENQIAEIEIDEIETAGTFTDLDEQLVDSSATNISSSDKLQDDVGLSSDVLEGKQ